MLEQIERILKANSLCVLCTVGGGHPYCSLMTYILSDDLRTLYMITTQESRKYENLRSNPHISVLVDTRQSLVSSGEKPISSVTFEGVYDPIEPGTMELIRTRMAREHGELAEILQSPGCVLLGIRLKSFLLLNGPVDCFRGEL